MKLFVISAFLYSGVILTHATSDVPTGPKAPISGASQNAQVNEPHKPELTVDAISQPVALHDVPVPKDEQRKQSEEIPSVPKPVAALSAGVAKTTETAHPTDEATHPTEAVHTTEPAHSTTSAPPTAGDWNVTENNSTCIMVHGIISLDVTLRRNSTHNETFKVDVAPKSKTHGTCSEEKICWFLDPSKFESLQFVFAMNDTTKEFYLSRVDGLLYVPHHHSNTTETVGFKNDTLKAFAAPKDKSYFCSKSVKEHIFHSNVTDIFLTLKDFQIQAFKSSKSHGFDESIDGCPSGGHGTPDIVPIIVGCALALLVVVVLVAYLINRRRSQAHGYLSM